MRHFKFLGLCFIAGMAASVHTAAGQGINPTVQTGSVRVTPTRAVAVAKPVVNTAVAPHVAGRLPSFTPRTFNTSAPRIIGQQGTNLRLNYSPVVRPLNLGFAAINAQRIARTREQEGITLNPATRQTELRTLAAMRERGFRNENATLAALKSQQHVTTRDPAQQPQSETRGTPKDPERTNWRNKNDHSNFLDAFHRHRHEWHD